MFRLLALLVCCIRLSAATETGRVASVAADGWAKVVPAKGASVQKGAVPAGKGAAAAAKGAAVAPKG
ncbi:MAG: hypothetical protein EBV64_14390, partial [Oxalobacteraceae bacterium]|nr:hypothetical protein [Oxalobacteraceae bacterium]